MHEGEQVGRRDAPPTRVGRQSDHDRLARLRLFSRGTGTDGERGCRRRPLGGLRLDLELRADVSSWSGKEPVVGAGERLSGEPAAEEHGDQVDGRREHEPLAGGGRRGKRPSGRFDRGALLGARGERPCLDVEHEEVDRRGDPVVVEGGGEGRGTGEVRCR